MSSMENTRLKTGDLVKLVAAVVFIIGWTITVYAWVAQIDRKVDLLSNTQGLVHQNLDTQIAGMQKAIEENNRRTDELVRAIDRATIVLEQLVKRFDASKIAAP